MRSGFFNQYLDILIEKPYTIPYMATLKRDVMEIELLPGRCLQGCSHCPNSKGPDTASFDGQSLRMLKSITQLLAKRGGVLDRLSIGGTPGLSGDRLPQLELPVSPRRITTTLGPIPDSGREQAHETISQFRTLFAGMRLDDTRQLVISVTPEIKSDGTIDKIDNAVDLFDSIFTSVTKGVVPGLNPQCGTLVFDVNSLDTRRFGQLFSQHDRIGQMQQALQLDLVCDAMSSQYPAQLFRRSINMQEETTPYHGTRCFVLTVEKTFVDHRSIQTSLRAIETPDNLKPMPTVLPSPGMAPLACMIEPRGVWVGHNNYNIGDRSVRFTHEEFDALLEQAESGEGRLAEVVHSTIQERRSRVLPVL